MTPATGGTVAPGVQTFAIPIPIPIGDVNVHLVELDEGYLLVDTAWGSRECFAALEQALVSRGVAWSDIRTVLVTHLHPDHVGNVQQVIERSGARYLMHAIDAQNLAAVAIKGRSPFFDEAWRLSGIPFEIREELDRRMGGLRRTFPSREPDWLLEGGETLSVKHGTLQIFWTPGHSAGHVCLYSPQHRFLIAGDHLLQYITPNIGWRPGEDMLARFFDSLSAVEQLAIDWVLPSHGGAFQNSKALIAGIREHHDARIKKILTQIRDEALTVYEIVGRLWSGRLDVLDQNFAVLEILAHLEYLRRRGLVIAEPAASGALLWRSGAGF